jgi:hypothetical protein
VSAGQAIPARFLVPAAQAGYPRFVRGLVAVSSLVLMCGALAACAQVAGLDQFSKGNCVAADCDASDNDLDATPDQTTHDGGDAGVVDVVDAGPEASADSAVDVTIDGGGSRPTDAAATCDACVDQTCINGVCAGVCAPNQTRCFGNLIQMCATSGNWQTQTTCSGTTPACLESTCVACSPPSAQCTTGNSFETCGDAGSWSSPLSCVDQTCINGACTGVCAPTQTQCDGNGVQTCTANGTWGGAVACTNSACVNGACAGSCSPGAVQCSGNGVETCSSSGMWGSPVTCEEPTPTCQNGACTCTETTCGTGANATCTLLNTTSNCSACGDVCNPANATTETCNGSTCSYTCDNGYSDCNTTAPNTDGCECATPACCMGGTNSAAPCETTHSVGIGGLSYYDCDNLYTTNPNTFTPITAMEACTAYAISQGQTAANCSDGWYCGPTESDTGDTTVCYCSTESCCTQTPCPTHNPVSTCTYCWGYSSPTDGGVKDDGWVETCTCPGSESSTYD